MSESLAPAHTDEDRADAHSAQVTAMVDRFRDEDILQYAAEQMHEILQEYVAVVIGQLSESPRWHGVQLADDVAIGIVAKLSTEFWPGDGNLFSRSQAREAFEVVVCSCGNVFPAASDDHLCE